MENKNLLLKRKRVFIIVLIFAALAGGVLIPLLIKQKSLSKQFSTPAYLKPASSQIRADGMVVSQNQDSLHFQTAGKLIYLPFKEGEQIFTGQVIASLDNLEAQKNVTAAEASYRSAKAALDLIIDNIHLFQYGNGGFANVGSVNETQTQKTQRQQAEEAVNIASDNLQKAQKQLENTNLISPFDGTIIHEDVRDVDINITPATNFILADLNKLVFQAQVASSDIAYIAVGDKVQIQLDSIKDKSFSGAVSKIYPEKINLSRGGEGYKVDIESAGLNANVKFGMTGSVLFENKFASHTLVLPSWLILGNQYVWVMDQNTPKLKEIKVGETFGDQTQVLGGLSDKDKVILNPQSITKKKYQII